MFTKQLKYDFAFSAKIFIAMFIGMIVISVVLNAADMLPAAQAGMVEIFRVITIGVGGTAVGIASYLQILLFFQRNFFAAEGYLMLTLPVSRGRLLASKFIVSLVWFNFMLLVVPIMLFIIFPPTGQSITDVIFNQILHTQNIIIFFTVINLVAFVAMAILFLTITLANTVVFGKKVHGVVAGIISAFYHFIFFYIFGQFQNRFYEMLPITGQFNHGEWRFYRYAPLIGWRYGRIPFGDYAYLDLWTTLFGLAFAAVTIAATLYLLKKKVALR